MDRTAEQWDDLLDKVRAAKAYYCRNFMHQASSIYIKKSNRDE